MFLPIHGDVLNLFLTYLWATALKLTYKSISSLELVPLQNLLSSRRCTVIIREDSPPSLLSITGALCAFCVAECVNSHVSQGHLTTTLTVC